MILPDINLLLYAYNADAPEHLRAKAWWESCLSHNRPIGVPWIVILGYIRIMISRRVFRDPSPPRVR